MTQELDATGLECPLPLLKAKQQLNRLKSGDTLRVRTTDPASERDFQSFCDLSGNQLLEASDSGGVFCFLLRKQ